MKILVLISLIILTTRYMFKSYTIILFIKDITLHVQPSFIL